MSKNLSTDWSKIAVLVFAGIIYLITFILDPAKAEASIDYSLREIRKLFIPLLVAVFVGATVKNLITPDVISKMFYGGRGILTAGVLGGVLPPALSSPTLP